MADALVDDVERGLPPEHVGDGVVEGLDRAKLAHQRGVAPAADADHRRAGGYRDLHRVVPDAARSADDQHALGRPAHHQARAVPEPLQRGHARQRQPRGVRVGHALGHRAGDVHPGERVFGRPARRHRADARVHPLPDSKTGHARAHRVDLPGDVVAGHKGKRRDQRPEDARNELPIDGVHAGRHDPNPHLARTRRGHGAFYQLKDFGAAVAGARHRAHGPQATHEPANVTRQTRYGTRRSPISARSKLRSELSTEA